jgi:hypothetical protein
MKRCLPLLSVLLAVSLASAVEPSQYWRDYISTGSVGIDGELLMPGSVVRAFDADGLECAEQVVVFAPGTWGFLHVYGDDPLTQIDEGALPGDTLGFTVDDIPYFTVPPTYWEAGDFMQYEVDLLPGDVRYLIGDVRYGMVSRVPMADVAVTLSGPSPASVTSAATGRFTHGPLDPGLYRVTVDAIDIDLVRTTVTAYDAALVLLHTIGSRVLTTTAPVADVSGDGNVTAFDASQILQYVVGTISEFDNPTNFWVDHDTLSFDYGSGEFPTASFVVQAVGDVSGVWNPISKPSIPDSRLVRSETDGRYVYRVAATEPIYSLTATIRTGGNHTELSLPSTWQSVVEWDDDRMIIAAAGASPLVDGTQVLTSNGPVSVAGVLNEDQAFTLASEGNLPVQATLALAPNPFNSRVQVKYGLNISADTQLRVYDISGRLVRTLVNEYAGTGWHAVSWDGRDVHGRDVASGLYIIHLVAGDVVRMQRAILVR